MVNIKRFFDDFFLFSLIALNILGFIGLLNEDMEFLAKIISWLLMTYLLYHLGFTKILVGYKHRSVDLILTVSYALFIVKDLYFYILDKAGLVFFENVIFFLRIHQGDIVFWSFNMAALLILAVAIYLSFDIEINDKSMFGAFGINKYHGILRFFIVLVSLSFMVYFIFMIIFQWFSIVIDAPLVMIALVYYLFATKKHDVEHILHKVGNFGEELLEKFISLFHDKNTIPIALAFILIMHFFTDIFVFIIPSIIPMNEQIYLDALGQTGTGMVYDLFIQQISGKDLYYMINLATIYISNLSFIIIIFLAPILILIELYRGKKAELHPLDNSFLIPTIILYFLFPMYKFFAIKKLETGMSGVYIILIQAKETLLFDYAAIIFVGLFIIVALVRLFFKSFDLTLLSIVLTMIPLYDYVDKYFNSTIYLTIENIRLILSYEKSLIIFFMIMFMFLVTMFYWPTIILFTYEIFKTNHIHILPQHIDREKLHDAIKFLIILVFLYLLMYFISSIFMIFKLNIIEFFIPIILTILLLSLPKLNSYFTKIDFGFSWVKLLWIPIVSLLGVVCGYAFVYFREQLIYPTKDIYMLIVFLIFVAMSEELIFRHYLQGYLSEVFSFRIAMILQSIVFALLHLQKNVNPYIIISIFGFGIILTLVKEKIGLFNAMTAHFFANFILYYYFLI